MLSLVHFLEIDLLHAGQYSLAPNERRLRSEAKHFVYLVSLHRGGRGPIFDCWPIRLSQRLPQIQVPLSGDDDYVPLDLQTVANRIYSEGGFWRSVEYEEAPNPPFRGKASSWADALLRERGLRP